MSNAASKDAQLLPPSALSSRGRVSIALWCKYERFLILLNESCSFSLSNSSLFQSLFSPPGTYYETANSTYTHPAFSGLSPSPHLFSKHSTLLRLYPSTCRSVRLSTTAITQDSAQRQPRGPGRCSRQLRRCQCGALADKSLGTVTGPYEANIAITTPLQQPRAAEERLHQANAGREVHGV
jgi:hypothetical protein